MKELFAIKSVEQSGNLTISTTPRGCKFIETDNTETPNLDVQAMFKTQDNQFLFYTMSAHITDGKRTETIMETIKTVLGLIYKDYGTAITTSIHITDWTTDTNVIIDPDNPDQITSFDNYSELLEKANQIFNLHTVH